MRALLAIVGLCILAVVTVTRSVYEYESPNQNYDEQELEAPISDDYVEYNGGEDDKGWREYRGGPYWETDKKKQVTQSPSGASTSKFKSKSEDSPVSDSEDSYDYNSSGANAFGKDGAVQRMSCLAIVASLVVLVFVR